MINVPSSPQLADSGQPISRTPSALRIDKDNLATLAHSHAAAVIERTQKKKTQRNLALAVGGALLVGGGIVFIATRGSNAGARATTGAASVASADTHPVVSATASTAPIASIEEAPLASASAAPSAHAHTGGHATSTHHVGSPPTATQSAPKGMGDVLEDRH